MKSTVVLCLLLNSFAAAPAAAQQPFAIVAHRGLAEGIPENTLAAFRQSASQGVRVIELDLRETKDGHIVVIHDETVDRTTDCSGRVAEMTLVTLRNCDAGWPTHPGERIPTFAEALDFINATSARLLLDVKSAPLGEVLRTIREHRAESKVILGLRRASDIARTRAELPAATTLAFMREASDAAAFAKAGAHIIRIWSDWVETDPTLVARTRALGPQAWVMIGRRLPSRDRDWRSLHGRMIATGAQGLISDRPDLISGQ
jgi:glycerophosphoryl diester phosphodiesterase